MRFNIALRHESPLSFLAIEDLAEYVQNGSRLAGHDCFTVEKPVPRGVNIVPSPLLQVDAVTLLEQLIAGTPCIILATELPPNRADADPITEIGPLEYTNQCSSAWWNAHFDSLRDVAEVATAIWCASTQLLPFYQSTFPQVPVLALPWCFDPLLEPLRPSRDDEIDYDLAFVGTSTPYRLGCLESLAGRWSVRRQTEPIGGNLARRDLLLRTKLMVHLGLSSDAVYSVPSRHHLALMSGRPIVSERAQTAGDLDHLIDWVDAADLPDAIAALIESDAWRTHGTERQEAYRATRPLLPAIEDLLDRSFG